MMIVLMICSGNDANGCCDLSSSRFVKLKKYERNFFTFKEKCLKNLPMLEKWDI
jgi:hypothetical protein